MDSAHFGINHFYIIRNYKRGVRMLNESQHNELAKGIGASEIAIVLGISPWKTPYELWLEKTGKVEREDLSEEPQIIMGNLLEPVIAARYAQKTQETLQEVPEAYVHPDYPYSLCHIDRLVVGKNKCLEIKKASPFSRSWGVEGSDEIPVDYIAQVQYQLGCTGFETADVASYRGGIDIDIYPFTRDDAVIKIMLQKADHFWKYHVLGDNPPPATTRGDLRLIYPSGDGNIIQATPEIIDICERFHGIKKEIKELTEQSDHIQFEVHKFMGVNDYIAIVDEIIVTNKADKNGKRSLRIKKRI